MSAGTLSPGELEEIVAVPERQTAVDSEGFIYDVNTGEVLGHAETTERFHIDSAEKADWALELRSKIEGRVAGLEARRKALLAQLDALRRDEMRRLSWWDYRFTAELTGFASDTIAGTKSRTAKFTWGSVAFRKTAGSHQIFSQDEAVAFVRTWEPSRIKVVETVGIKDILAARETATKATGELQETNFLKATEERESVTISTGIQIEGS